MSIKIKSSFCILFLGFFCFAQLQKTDETYKTILKLDSLIFERGFNKCDQSSYDKIVSDDLEFYHDNGGITNGKKEFENSIKNNICGSSEKPNRELQKTSLKLFPLYNQNNLYGVIEEGIHYFSTLQKAGKRKRVGSAKFSILWLKDQNNWKLKRVFSYDHQAVK